MRLVVVLAAVLAAAAACSEAPPPSVEPQSRLHFVYAPIMRVEYEYTVTLSIDARDEPDGYQLPMTQDEMELKDLIRRATSYSARLEGGAFVISPEGGVTQAASSSAPVIWNWRISPSRNGPAQRRLTLSVDAFDGETATRVGGAPYPYIVHIRVPPDIALRNWLTDVAEPIHAVMAAILVSVGGLIAWLRRSWLAALFRRRRQPPPD